MTAPAPAAPSGGRFDARAIVRGAAFGNLLALPGALVNSALSGEDDASALLALSFLAVTLGFVVAGLVAGANAPGEPSRHGALAGLAAFVPVELIAILGRLDREAPIRPAGIVLLALLAATAASGGALLGARRRSDRTTPEEGS